ncbi:SusC/RagA family TonB-linked outer membrane protein [Hufsiella ginkgonis]|uniref:SusC/RagA family TonB-linked outer membrane protein n=1 Tax=Hufsiella ginkgonis TaxID=2695274 RepID=A0A7K1XZ27_9SPHI|nr:SusC/RagA family TonB-linked outer membrane protein [Hufsiella ginkgonis]MXV16077.1 SusC/RagA family TonB-linked outer membrane protein [Hufsiella ginkgonis]
MKRSLSLIIVCVAGLLPVLAQQQLKGRVTTTESIPLAGASVRLTGSPVATTSDSTGTFTLPVSGTTATLSVSYIGYSVKTTTVTLPVTRLLIIALEPAANQLKEVVVSTGYQQISAERAAGSFVQVDNALLNRSISTNILDRLQDVVPGLVFNRYRGAKSDISIRGSSTIFSNAEPLIVVDNFPYEGDMDNINPSDVESITVLKDAAAASIWGSRAGNGVIVITTKKGGYNKAAKISFNSNFTTTDKRDQFYVSRMSSADFVDIEKLLFSRGYYTAMETAVAKTALSPVVELLIARRDGKLSATEADRQIDLLKEHDVRSDLDKYFFRNTFRQQHALNISGGSEFQRYYISGGYDKNKETNIGNEYSRVTLNATNTYSLMNKKLDVTAGLYYTSGLTTTNGSPIITTLTAMNYPYSRLADENGNPLTVTRSYRASLNAAAAAQGLLNWEYKPLAELYANDNNSKTTDYRANISLKYRLPAGLSAEGIYQYWKGGVEERNLRGTALWTTRDLINKVTIVNADGTLTRPVPVGAILEMGNVSSYTHTARGQLNYSFSHHDHEVTALAGGEVKNNEGSSRYNTTYGYDDVHALGSVVDYVTSFKSYTNSASTLKIPFDDVFKETTDRFISWFGNAGYTFRKKYTVTGSARFDQSNIFGVNTNQKGVPLWSAGAIWNISDEGFYKSGLVPSLRLRLTYGYSGNVNKSLTAYTTVNYNNGASSLTRLPFATLNSAPNPELRWERVKIMNAAVDFTLKNSLLSGSLEIYRKLGYDLIGDAPFPPSTGISNFRGNVANTSGNGADLNLTSKIPAGSFNWQGNFFMSYIKERITKYLVASSGSLYVTNGDGGSGTIAPFEGKPLYAVYSYQWGGLDPANGDPRGYLDGVLSKDYVKIISSSTPANIIYHGPVNPVVYGAFRNTVNYKSISLSANLSYRLGYYFKRPTVSYTVLYGAGVSRSDYALRWQKPGDEAFTTIPSMPAAANSNRDSFFAHSSVNVEKGDHVRLQDVRLSYNLPKLKLRKLALSGGQFFAYASNLGVLWKATKSNYDPDYINVAPLPRSIAGGFRADF